MSNIPSTVYGTGQIIVVDFDAHDLILYFPPQSRIDFRFSIGSRELIISL